MSAISFNRTMLAGILLLTALLLACNNDPVESQTPEDTETTAYADWVSFDTTSFFAHVTSLHAAEYYYDGDYLIGEPFTDLNGNGVYDAGIDPFVMSPDPLTNMDLNHNGRYDGPNDAYTLGLPFDDLNQNGVFDQRDLQYSIGELFCDINGDGYWNNLNSGNIIRWIPFAITDGTTSWGFERRDSVAYFTSDSGRSYWVPERNDAYWDFQNDRYRRSTEYNLETNDSGLFFVHNYDTYRLPVLRQNPVVCDSQRIVLSGFSALFHEDTASFFWTVTPNERLEVADTAFSDLLCVKFDSTWVGNDSTRLSLWNHWSFYFAKDHGLIALQMNSRWIYFLFKQDTLPLPLVRETAATIVPHY